MVFAESQWSIDLRLDTNDNCISLENSLFEKTGLSVRFGSTYTENTGLFTQASTTV